ncbi:MAG: DNA polymerase I [Muribaculaceae bacterium]|nr:DNA polymerase I [Muribaculaceae bacterium]
MEDKKLFLIDAYGLIYRAYYALLRSPRMSADGLNTSAIYGFCTAIEDVIKKENPGYMAVCFDPAGGKTFRHQQYPEYKAQRDKQPEDITLSVPYIKDILKAMRIEVLEKEGYEADDIIGTLSVRAAAEGFTTYMMTLDKDYGQLVNERVFMYRPALQNKGFEIRGPQQVCERYDIENPLQVIDLLALEGDASDNIPGCPGVGEKTASKLIKEFGSVENLIKNTGELKGALRKKIEDNARQIEFSKELVTICTSVPLEIQPEDLVRREPDVEALRDIYKRLGFRSLLSRMQPEAETEKATEKNVSMGSLFDSVEESGESINIASKGEQNYERLESIEEISRFIEPLTGIEKGLCGVSVHATGEEAMSAVLRGVAVSRPDGKTAYIAYPVMPTEQPEVSALLAPLFAAPHVTICSTDVKRSMLVLRRYGVEWTAPYYDVAVAHYLVSPESSHEMSAMAMAVAGYKTVDADMVALQRKKFYEKEGFEQQQAVCEQAELCVKLYEPLNKILKSEQLEHLNKEIEQPMVRVLAQMEWNGVRIDVNELAAISRRLTERLHCLEQEVYEMAGKTFNVGSPAQVGEILFERLAIDPKAKKTKSGAWSTTEEILEKYRSRHPIINLILEIRGLKKLLATYVDALPRLINPVTGKLHTTFKQTVTATGRLSSTNPNLQNIPVRTEDGREIRRAFIADDGDLILSADYSQIELRLMADISGDSEMINAFLSGADIHRATAAKIYHVAEDEVSDTQRRNAKTANFGIIYGISAFGLSERLGIPRGEAKELIETYLKTYPRVQQYMQESIEGARGRGYVSTVMGRRRMLPDINSRNSVVRGYAERNAINAPLQGSAADIIKLAMVRIARVMEERAMKSTMIMQVHDELIFNVKPQELAELQQLVVREMEGAYKGRVPLTVSSGTATNWLEAH